MQSVFIIRSQNDINLKSSPTLTLVIISLLASLFSIANKYIWADKECVVDEAKQAKSGDSIVNKWYILRIVWRFCYVLVRFSIFSMLWSVIGGAFLGIFIPLSWIYWVIIMVYTFKIGCGEGVLIVGYGFVALVASPAFQSYAWAICHGIEMIIALTLITVFATIESIDCGICADPVLRQATNNGYIMAFLIAGWVALPIDFITYFIMLKFERFQGEGETFLTVVSEGVGA